MRSATVCVTRASLVGAAVLVVCPPGADAQTQLPPVVVQSSPAASPRPAEPRLARPTESRVATPRKKQAAAAPPGPSSPDTQTSPAPTRAAEPASSGWPPSPDALRGNIPQLGVAGTASSGVIGQDRLEARPIYRPADILESVPGLVISQHSGEGKANQYYLRGFNLDHGTDIAIFMDGMPVNMPSHGHGQGYADANFMIPELVRGLSFHKGPYFSPMQSST